MLFGPIQQSSWQHFKSLPYPNIHTENHLLKGDTSWQSAQLILASPVQAKECTSNHYCHSHIHTQDHLPKDDTDLGGITMQSKLKNALQITTVPLSFTHRTICQKMTLILATPVQAKEPQYTPYLTVQE